MKYHKLKASLNITHWKVHKNFSDLGTYVSNCILGINVFTTVRCTEADSTWRIKRSVQDTDVHIEGL